MLLVLRLDLKIAGRLSEKPPATVLKTAPRGYPKDHPDAALLKLKSFITEHVFSDEEVKSRRFYKSVLAAFDAMRPLNVYLTEAIS